MITDDYFDTDWTLVSFEKPAPKPQTAPVLKGTCPKCGKHIGRGIAFHVKRCDDRPAH